MIHRLLLSLFLLIGLVSGVGYAQQSAAEKKIRAKEFLYYGRYANALALLSNDRTLNREDSESRFLIAVCLFQLNRLDEAEARLKALLEESRSPYPEYWLYLAKVYHARHEFDEAARHYKIYLKTIKSDHPNRQMVVDEIRRCSNGLDFRYKQPKAIVENLGAGVNTEGDEFGLVLSPNYSERLYFSAMRNGNVGGLRNSAGSPDEEFGSYFSDMYSSRLADGIWGEARLLDNLLNSMRHEILLDFRRDGSALYYFKGWTPGNGEIVVNSFQQLEERALSSDPFLGPLDARNGDRDLYFANDTLLFFSSRRAGGYGGADIYSSTFSNGQWSAPMNLGPIVNSAYDEVTPFLALDGRTLYFSSNNASRSMGGLDVFKTQYVEEVKSWALPVNLGLPVNSAGDDAFFRLAPDGFSAYFASSRKDGFGMRDLYSATFFDFLPEQEPPASFVAQRFERPPQVIEPSIRQESVATESAPLPATPQPAPNIEPAYDIVPIRFGESRELFEGVNQTQLDRIASLMLEYPQLKLVVSAYSDKPSSLEDNIFEAVRNAEQAAHYLTGKGVAPESIFMRGLNAPFVERSSGQGRDMGVEFSFLGTSGLPVQGRLPVIGNGYQSLFPNQATNQAFFYKVQISSLRGVYKGARLSTYSYPMVETTPGFNYYRYTLGAFERFEEAEAFQKKLIREGFSGAFIVPYIYGFRSDKDMAKRHLGVFPDLADYLNR